jgi:ArsR family transcriptional regulator, arsenate/arsenite/antimonite-responsive transcriptional repressor / arsenate reductase (thioredoxin)
MLRCMDLDERARIHAALGDRHRLAMVDALRLGDRTFQELAEGVGLRGNLAAHHLDVLEAAGLIERRISEGDHRRRYIRLRHERLGELALEPPLAPAFLLFVCTHNSARSQFAAALWQQRTGLAADSAGTEPAARVHPGAVDAAREYGLDLHDAIPKRYEAVGRSPDLVVSVCDRAHEAGLPFTAPSAHWSIPDPVAAGTSGAFRSAFASIAERIDQLAPTNA